MSSLPPVFLGSSIVGFISFAFTFFTFFNIFWNSLMTMKSAPRKIREYLGNLRSELYGEREYFKIATKSARSRSRSNPREYVNCGPLKILNDAVKELMHDFKRLETPFLENPAEEEQRDVEKSERVSFRASYAPFDFKHRFIWLQVKKDVVSLADQVIRIQARRIAFDTNTAVT